MIPLVSVDIGGTHVRFARAETGEGRVLRLDEAIVLRTADHVGLVEAWAVAVAAIGGEKPRAAAIAFAGPVQGEMLRLTNNAWTIDRARLLTDLAVDRVTLVNDFGAVGHAVAQLDGSAFRHLCGPELPLPNRGLISVVGPGTGLGVAHVFRHGRSYHVGETEGGHIAFAPLDRHEDAVVAALRLQFGRVSAERIVSGPGLAHFYSALAAPLADDGVLWSAALDGSDAQAAAALDRWCGALGAVAGDIALAQGASAVVIAGPLANRLGERLAGSSFAARFADKGRLRAMMEKMPVKLLTHPQPGLYGAAAAFARQHHQ